MDNELWNATAWMREALADRFKAEVAEAVDAQFEAMRAHLPPGELTAGDNLAPNLDAAGVLSIKSASHWYKGAPGGVWRGVFLDDQSAEICLFANGEMVERATVPRGAGWMPDNPELN